LQAPYHVRNATARRSAAAVWSAPHELADGPACTATYREIAAAAGLRSTETVRAWIESFERQRLVIRLPFPRARSRRAIVIHGLDGADDAIGELLPAEPEARLSVVG